MGLHQFGVKLIWLLLKDSKTELPCLFFAKVGKVDSDSGEIELAQLLLKSNSLVSHVLDSGRHEEWYIGELLQSLSLHKAIVAAVTNELSNLRVFVPTERLHQLFKCLVAQVFNTGSLTRPKLFP